MKYRKLIKNKQTNKQAIVNYWRQIMWPIVGNESALRHIDSSPYVISFLILKNLTSTSQTQNVHQKHQTQNQNLVKGG